MPRFSCPVCQKSLKVLADVPAGKKIRCPGCGEIFRYQGEEALAEADEALVSADQFSAAAPVASKGRVPKSAETPPPPSTRKTRRGDSGGADRSPAQQGKPRGNKRLMVLLAIAAVLAVAVGITGFIWPGFFLDSGRNKEVGPAKKFVPKISSGASGESGPDGGVAESGAKSIKQIMARIDRGPQALGKVIGKELNKDMPPWDELAPKTKELAELAGALGALKPNKGEMESWTTHSAAFAKSAADLDQFVQSKDRDSALAAHKNFENSCMACHQQHKGGPGGFGPKGGKGMKKGPPPDAEN